MDPLLENYLIRSLDVFLNIGSVELEWLDLDDEEEEATLLATMRFPDGSRLHVRMAVQEADEFPSIIEYAFHFMTSENATIFRYDNSEYHHGFPNFPHHKHEGADERVVGCPQPSISLIRDEIEAYLKGLI